MIIHSHGYRFSPYAKPQLNRQHAFTEQSRSKLDHKSPARGGQGAAIFARRGEAHCRSLWHQLPPLSPPPAAFATTSPPLSPAVATLNFGNQFASINPKSLMCFASGRTTHPGRFKPYHALSKDVVYSCAVHQNTEFVIR